MKNTYTRVFLESFFIIALNLKKAKCQVYANRWIDKHISVLIQWSIIIAIIDTQNHINES